MGDICEISNSIFENFKNSENGGVFNFINLNFHLICSYFSNNSVTKRGGCIYSSGSQITTEKSVFYKCCSLANQDNTQGNIGYLTSSDVILDNIGMVLCGYSTTYRSDSTFILETGYDELTYINASDNHGIGGGSGYSLYSCKEGSFAKYGNIANGKDSHMIEAVNNGYSIYKTNLINCTECHSALFYQTYANLLYFEDCFFINTGNVNFCNDNLAFNAKNTYSDKASGSVQITNKLQTHEITLQMKCPFFYYEKHDNFYFSSVFFRPFLFSSLLNQLT